MSTPAAKVCPKCNKVSPLDAMICAQCGHQFRTQFTPPVDQTQMLLPPQAPPQQVPNQYPPNYQTPYNPPPQYPPNQYPPPYQNQRQYPPPYQQPYRPDLIQGIPGTHQPALAAILSLFLFSVGGQMINRQYVKAIVVLVLGMIASVITAGIALIPYYIFTVVDAYKIAERLNRGEAVGQWQCF